jgi:hypothetical protein
MMLSFVSCTTVKKKKKRHRVTYRKKCIKMPMPLRQYSYLPSTYMNFLHALRNGDVDALNSLLSIRCEFKEIKEKQGQYAFYRDNKIIIGPFPLKAYKNSLTLNLTRPAGISINDYSRFHLFSRNHDLYFHFGDDHVSIEGDNETGTKQLGHYTF